MTVAELMQFLSKLDPTANVTLTKTDYHDGGLFGDDEYIEPWDEDVTTELEQFCISVDVLHGGTVDFRFI